MIRNNEKVYNFYYDKLVKKYYFYFDKNLNDLELLIVSLNKKKYYKQKRKDKKLINIIYKLCKKHNRADTQFILNNINLYKNKNDFIYIENEHIKINSSCFILYKDIYNNIVFYN